MKITSNDTALLEAFYSQLKHERIKNITLEKEPVEGAMGWIPTIDIKSSDFTDMIKDMFRAWLEYKKFKLYIEHQDGLKKEIDIDTFEQIKEDTKIVVEFEKR